MLHRWLGIAIGLLLAMQGLTGALLVFHREFDQAGVALHDGASLPASELFGIATRTAGHRIERLNSSGDDPRLIEARFVDAAGAPRMLLMEASTGRVVGEREREPETPFTGSAWRWVMRLHVALTMGLYGELAIGLAGIVLFTMIVSGLCIAWPRRRMWRAIFAVSAWKSSVQKFYGWHRAVGLVASLPIAVYTVTGLYMVFDHSIAPLVGVQSPYTAVAGHTMVEAGAAGPEPAIGPDEALTIAREEFPGGRLVSLIPPAGNPGHYVVRLRQPGDPRSWAGRATVMLDGETGFVLARYNPREVGAWGWIDDRVYPLHTGEMGGFTGRLLTVLAGLAPPTFFVTGILLWWRKGASKRRKRASKAVAGAPPLTPQPPG